MRLPPLPGWDFFSYFPRVLAQSRHKWRALSFTRGYKLSLLLELKSAAESPNLRKPQIH
jgi:hypothetical protein